MFSGMDALPGQQDLFDDIDKQPDFNASPLPSEPKKRGRSRPPVANVGYTPPVRSMIDDVDQQRTARGEPPVKHDDETFAEASRLLAGGKFSETLAARANGGQLNDAETVAAIATINREGLAAILAGDKAAVRQSMDQVEACRTGTEWGRAGRMRHDPLGGSPRER